MNTTDFLPAPHVENLHRECFACGVSNERGLRLHFDTDDEGIARAVWLPSSAFRSYPDRVHGGVLATLVDSAIVHCLFARGIAGVTAELNLRYLHSVRVTDPVDVRAWRESSRHGLHLCRAEIRQNEILVVKAAAKFMAMPDLDPRI